MKLNPRQLVYLLLSILFLTLLPAFSALAIIAQQPLYLTTSVTPIVMLNLSKDHQLYFKAFDDFSDLDKDGIVDTTYKNSIDYYGYFDSYKCYSYNSSGKQFEPSAITNTKYCNNQWSGNFLNWATMTRIDTIRKILYGGYRSTDTGSATVLERTYLPNDAHSFAKFYKGADLAQLTPYNSSNGITLCNTTVSSTQFSQNVTDPPLIRVAKGDYSLWAANERWQCRWSNELGTSNSNDITASGLSAANSNPGNNTFNGAVATEYVARVQVCVSKSLLGKENCKSYPDGTQKTVGLLQTYGDDDSLRFGLLTGSFGKNKSGGVLRKNVSSITDEINVSTNGTFKSVPVAGSIIGTLNALRIYGYNHQDGTYLSTGGGDNCVWGLNAFNDGQCSNWGNPQAEIFLESLRYLTNHSALNAFLSSDTSYISGLKAANAANPISSSQWCAKINVIQFNASTTSYDGDQLGNITDITSTSMNSLTNSVGSGENITGNAYFVGENGTNNNQICTAKTVANLSDVRGTCPDSPRLSGSYHIAGLAQYANNNDMLPSLSGDQRITTYGVALSPNVPKIQVNVPGSSKIITILPACRNSTVNGNCAIVDFKIVHQDCAQLSLSSSTYNCGKVYVNWEDSEQGGDFDQDEWGILTYSVSASQVNITTDVIAQSTPYLMGFGYILGGTTQDGFHAHSGINGFTYADPLGTAACNNCNSGNGASSASYAIGSSAALTLQQPLYYAAKWGGFIDSNNNSLPDLQSEWDSNPVDGIPDRYFYATNPGQLATSLSAAFANVLSSNSSASASEANATKLSTDTLIYQPMFDPKDWSGQILAWPVDPVTRIITSLTPNWDAASMLPSAGSRNIYTYNPNLAAGSRGLSFLWSSLNATQQSYLNQLLGTVDNLGQDRLNWLRGDNNKEKRLGGNFRNRIKVADTSGLFLTSGQLSDGGIKTNKLGDFGNSDPVFVNTADYGYAALPGTEGSSYSTFKTANSSRIPMLYVGANDGMLHGFDAQKNTGTVTTGGTEKLAYVPNALFSELSKLTAPTYAHQYFVDGYTSVSDAYYNSAWHTLLVGSTGAGGKAVFGLDITNPSTFSATNVLWEFSNTDDADLGYTLSQPVIARMHNGKWVVIVANGYGSSTGASVLYFLDAPTGSIIKKIDTGATGLNGLSSPTATDTNGDYIVDVIYAGDLQGNLWKFDVSSAAPTQWAVANSGKPLFVACTSTGTTCATSNRQPITSRPVVGSVGSDQGSGYMLYFGTGKYFDTTDNIVGSSPQTQSFYGLWDQGSVITDRINLQEQTINFEGVPVNASGLIGSGIVRTTSRKTLCYSTNTLALSDDDTPVITCSSGNLKKGWVMNLLKPVNIAQGERVVSPPQMYYDLITFTSLIPNSDPCKGGGEGRIMVVEALTGKRTTKPAFDVFSSTGTTPDHKVDSGDLVMVNNKLTVASAFTLANGIVKSLKILSAGSSGSIGDNGITNTPGFSSFGGSGNSNNSSTNSSSVGATVYGGGSDGSMGSRDLGCRINCSGKTGFRISWRQLQ